MVTTVPLCTLATMTKSSGWPRAARADTEAAESEGTGLKAMTTGSPCGGGGRVGRTDLVLGVAALALGLVVGSGVLLALTLAATIVAPFGLALMPVLMLGLWASLRRQPSSASGRDRMEPLAGGRPSSRTADRVEIDHVAGQRKAA